MSDKNGIWASRPGYKPVILMIAVIVFTGLVLMPPPQSMIDLASNANPPGYTLSTGCKTITDSINKRLRPHSFKSANQTEADKTEKVEDPISPKEAAQMAKVMLGIFFFAVVMWGTEALSLGATNILIAVLMYLFAILPIDEIAKAYMSDAVFFIFGIPHIHMNVARTFRLRMLMPPGNKII